MTELIYTALLGNVNRTILNIRLGDDFSVDEWPIADFVAFYEEMHGSAEHDIWFKLDEEWGYGHGRKYRPKYVYVVAKRFKEYPKRYSGKDMEKWWDAYKKLEQFESHQSQLLEDKISKLRLCREGSIKVCVEFFYTDADGKFEMESSQEESLHCENRPFRIRKKDIPTINRLLNGPLLATSHKYLSFALQNFSQSYRVAQTELEFITLMLAFEAIFNDGKQELRNKVSRGCAVLLGRTKALSREIFKDVRDLYDKRSILVHTGDNSKVTHADVILLKSYVRESLLRVFELGVPKEELLVQLSEAGFGSFAQIAKSAITSRSSRRAKARG